MSYKSKVFKVLCYFQYSNADNLHLYQETRFQEHKILRCQTKSQMKHFNLHQQKLSCQIHICTVQQQISELDGFYLYACQRYSMCTHALLTVV